MVSIVKQDKPNLKNYLQDRFKEGSEELYGAGKLAETEKESVKNCDDKIAEVGCVIDVAKELLSMVAAGARKEEFDFDVPYPINQRQVIKAISEFYKGQGLKPLQLGDIMAENFCAFPMDGSDKLYVCCMPLDESDEDEGNFSFRVMHLYQQPNR